MSREPRVLPKVAEAVAFALRVHDGQQRPGGESQYDHLMRVGEIASRFADRYSEDDIPPEFQLSDEEIETLLAAAVLHDVLEDTDTTYDELVARFGEQIANVVRAVSHVEEEEADEVYLRRVAEGGRLAIIVKRSDRLDNLNTLRHASSEFRKRKLAEIRAALPLWHEIDPDSAPLIEELLQEVEQHATAC